MRDGMVCSLCELNAVMCDKLSVENTAQHQQHGLLSLALAKHHAGESAGAAAESGSAKVDRRKIATSQRVPDMQTAMLSAASEKLQLPGELVVSVTRCCTSAVVRFLIHASNTEPF